MPGGIFESEESTRPENEVCRETCLPANYLFVQSGINQSRLDNSFKLTIQKSTTLSILWVFFSGAAWNSRIALDDARDLMNGADFISYGRSVINPFLFTKSVIFFS